MSARRRPAGSAARAATLATALALLAAGCSGREERATTTGGASTGGTGGWSAGVPTVRVGLVAPLTGPFAVLGVSQRNSMQVEIDRINEAGGLGGARLELVERDTALDPGRAVQAANELTGDQQVRLIVGPSLSAFYNAVKQTYENQQQVNCQPAVATGDFDPLRFGFRSQDQADQGIEKTLQHLQRDGVRSIGIVYEGDDTGRAIAATIERLAPTVGMQFTGYQQTRPDDQSHRGYVENLRQSDAIWLSNNASGARTLAAAGELNYDGRLVSGSGMQNINFLEAAGAAADGATFYAPYYPYPTRVDRAQWRPGYRRHIEAVVTRFGENVGERTGARSPRGTAIAADCIFGLERAANAARSLDPEPVAQAWTALNVPESETPSGNSLNVGPDHEHYDMEDIRLYRWRRDAQGWFTEDVTG